MLQLPGSKKTVPKALGTWHGEGAEGPLMASRSKAEEKLL